MEGCGEKMAESIPITKGGMQQLQDELQRLRNVERPQVINAIAEARGHGDLKENAEYHAAKEKQAFIEGRISLLEDQLARCKIVELRHEDLDVVRFGALVTLVEEESGKEKTLQLVGDLEADINQSRISINSPIGKAIIGKKLDTLVSVKAPKGTVDYVITAIACPPKAEDE